MTRPPRIDGLTLAGIALLLFFTASIVRGWGGEGNPAAAAPTPVPTPDATLPEIPPPEIVPPYDTYVLTQGIHGQSYGHYAIDIAAGNGATIKSIISGTVTGTGYDQWGNTFIQIENDAYAVLYLHGHYSAVVGEAVAAGQAIGTESNIGYTLDIYGNSCAGRDCGYHTHLNVFDKRLGSNIDPLTLIPANYP